MPTIEPRTVKQLYSLAKSGDWGRVLRAFDDEPSPLAMCSRFREPSSGWTFLHQAAHLGNEAAARRLIAAGASLAAGFEGGEAPAEVAAKHGHGRLSLLLESARETGDHLWEPSPDPDLLPSSRACNEAVEARAAQAMRVAYGGVVISIPRGSRYFVDALGRTLVGWHGTYNPPLGMDYMPMVEGFTAIKYISPRAKGTKWSSAKKAAVHRERKAAARKAALTKKRSAAGMKAALTKKRSAAAKKAAVTRSRQAAGKKAAITRKHRAAGEKAAKTKKRRATGRKVS